MNDEYRIHTRHKNSSFHFVTLFGDHRASVAAYDRRRDRRTDGRTDGWTANVSTKRKEFNNVSVGGNPDGIVSEI